MKVNVQVAGLATLYEALRRNKNVAVEFPGGTLGELIDALIRRFGTKVKKALLDQNGDVDMEIRVLLNGETYLTEDRMQTPLQNGDTLVFLAPS